MGIESGFEVASDLLYNTNLKTARFTIIYLPNFAPATLNLVISPMNLPNL